MVELVRLRGLKLSNLKLFSRSMAVLYSDEKDVLAVSGWVAWDQGIVSLNDDWTVEATKDRFISGCVRWDDDASWNDLSAWCERNEEIEGFLNTGAGMAFSISGGFAAGCLPLEVRVSFGEQPESELSEGRFLAVAPSWELGLACTRRCADLEDAIGDGGGSSSSVGEPGSGVL